MDGVDLVDGVDGAKKKTWQEISGLDHGNLHSLPEGEYRAGLEKLMEAAEKIFEEVIWGLPSREVRITGKEVRDWPRVMSLRTPRKSATRTSTTEDTEGTEGNGDGREGRGEGVGVELRGSGEEGTRDRLKAELRTKTEMRTGTMERTYLWEPVRVVCRRLEISHSMLSYLSREYSGMAAHEIGDRIKARRLKEKFWLRMRGFALKLWARPGIMDFNEKEWAACARWSSFTGERLPRRNGPFFILDQDEIANRRDPYSNNLPGTDALHEQLWTAWISHKRSAGFDRNVWAMECGFANWSRMRRACLLEFNMTPQQMEYAIAYEIADYYDVGATVRNREQLMMDKDLPERLRPTEPYIDKHTAYVQIDPGWMSRMGELFGALA